MRWFMWYWYATSEKYEVVHELQAKLDSNIKIHHRYKYLGIVYNYSLIHDLKKIVTSRKMKNISMKTWKLIYLLIVMETFQPFERL